MTTRFETDPLRVVLVRTRNPLNIGAAARAMSNFAFLHLRVVNPYEAAFREARSAVGASAVMAAAVEFPTVAAAIADCSLVVGTTAVGRRKLQQPVEPLESAAALIRKRLRSGRVALLFGSEKTGLSNRDLSLCHVLLRIPTREEHGSMNLGQAVAVCLYELARGSGGALPAARAKAATSTTKASASAEMEDRINGALLEALRASGYLKPGSSAISEDKLRRLVRRLNLSAGDAELWLGMLRQILWKLHHGGQQNE